MKRQSVSCSIGTLLVFALGVVLAASSNLQAQVDTGAISGTVTDASGAVVGGAKVTLTNTGTNAALEMVTGSDGGYKFSPVKIGTYKLTATSQGFQTVTQTGVTV